MSSIHPQMSHRAQKPLWQRQRLVYSLQNLVPLLFKAKEISKEQVKLVNSRAEQAGLSFQSAEGLDFLLALGLKRFTPRGGKGPVQVTEDVVLRAVAAHLGLEYKKVDYLDLDLEVSTKTISESFARTNLLVPLKVVNGTMELLVFNPFQPDLWEDMEQVSSMPYRIFLGTRSEINRLIDDFFQFRLAIQAAEAEFDTGLDLGNLEGQVQVGNKQDSHSHKHVIKAVDYLLISAIRERASDIHLEPKRGESHVRFRIDGVLHTLYRLPMTVHQAMISRLKSLSRLDIAEKRKPQDGRIQLMLQNVPTEVRLSTIPVAFGEKMVLRLLSKETSVKGLSQMGMSDEQFERFSSFLGQSYGLILVTGPTGSGKSTTLYSALKNLATPTINVVTVEDPIEMVVEDFNQIGVQDRVGVSFSNILRHILRQDPDIVMIGEIRDLDTARQAVQASLTGHLVFSTLHTNDAVSALTRLTDIGLEPYLINASLVGVVAQRLVRCICPHCKTRTAVSSEQIRNWGLERHASLLESDAWFGAGCEHCRQTGYLDRTGIFEILPLDLKLKEGVRQGLELAELRKIVRSSAVRSLLESGLDKVGQGVTTVEEVLRVTGEIDDPYQ